MRTQLNAVYGEESPSWATIKLWYNEFQSGRTTVIDEERTRRPTEISSGITHQLIKIVQSECRITIREMAGRLNVTTGTVHSLLAENGIRKLCSRFVPRLLTAEMQANRLDACRKNLQLLQVIGDRLLSNIITMDETPLSLYVPQSRRESQEWKLPGESFSIKMRSSTSHRKATMLSVFWDATGIVLIDFADTGISLNTDYYCNFVQEARRRRRKSRVCDFYYFADNAPIHTSNQSATAVASLGLTVLLHPPYSPDLAPSDFYLFRHLKEHLRGHRFLSKEDVKASVTEFLDKKPPNFFKSAFEDLETRWKKCVEKDGNYFEK